MPPRIRTLGYYLRYRQPVFNIVAAVGLLVVTVILLMSYRNKWDLALLTGVLGVMGLNWNLSLPARSTWGADR